LGETVTTSFEAKLEKTVAIGFEAKPVKTVRVVLRPNHSQTVDRLATKYPTYAIIPGPLHQVSYSCHGPRRCTACHTCHLYTTGQENVIFQMKQR
jgi:hypothetical protein